MIEIKRITFREIELPLREPFRISSGSVSSRRILLARVESADGLVAWSECVAGERPNYSPETIDTAWLALTQWITPRVVGRAFETPAALFDDLELTIRGHRMAKAVVEMASWCLLALQRGESLARTIGSTRDTIEVGISLGIQPDPATLVAKAEAAHAEGYRKIKIKISPGSDVPFVRAVRDALGPDAGLMADANNAYVLADIDVMLALDELGLIMIEQPLAWDDIPRHADLQSQLKTPICLDESITSLERAEDMVTLAAGRIVNIKPGRVGGFAQSVAIHDFCRRSKVPVWCGGMLESGIGRSYNVALASLPNFVIPGDISPSARYWARDVVTPEWTMDREGRVTVPRDRPGLGVDVDEDRIDDLTVRTETTDA